MFPCTCQIVPTPAYISQPHISDFITIVYALPSKGPESWSVFLQSTDQGVGKCARRK